METVKNVFAQHKKHGEFSWEQIGDITAGRGDLGAEVPVLMYRLMQFTMLDVLVRMYGKESANVCFRQSGFLAGSEFARNILDLRVDFDGFLAGLQKALHEQKVGILRMEAFDPASGGIALTVGQDLDCSGLPITNENVCSYDEGFIAGILEAYTGKKYDVREVDCWANGNRVCRFEGNVVK